ncbi:MAG: Diacylglycerol kinase [Gemmatimonadaceae bacterium]|nr:Diacylglycerol kinase [Gemmatimonadaceae bacterium]
MTRRYLIANPAAGRGRGARLIGPVRERLAACGPCEAALSTRSGHERELARAAAASGVEEIVALGGDGTWSNVARGILDVGADCRLALIAGGTGNDFAFAAGLPTRDVAAMVEIAIGPTERRIDVGLAGDVAFLNIASFGFAPHVLAASQRVSWLRGHAVYLVTAARRIASYPGLVASAAIDGETPTCQSRILAIVVSNGPRFGGGFLVSPGASISDGVLEVVTVRDASALRRARLLAAVTRGSHGHLEEVAIRKSLRARLDFDAPPLFDADGDLFQADSRTIEVRVLPSRLRLAAGIR